MSDAPGAPGIEPRWTSSAKSAIGTALGSESRIWFTISHGILDEIYAPRLDSACTRDFGLIVTAKGYFSDEKRDTISHIEMIEEGVPAFRLVNAAKDGRYRMTKTIFSDPLREVVLQDIHFEALEGVQSDYAVHAIIAPHLVNAGAENTAWVGDFKGHQMLFAEGRGTSLAVALSVPWLVRSAGYVGVSDGWQTLSQDGSLNPEFQRAEKGNVALSGTLDLDTSRGRALMAIGFGVLPEEAALRTLLSIQSPIATMLEGYCAEWRAWQKTLQPLDEPRDREGPNHYRVSTAVLASHREDESGAIIASLSIPWGYSKGDDDLGGYHLVWPRDLVETAGGLLAAGSAIGARSVLDYLRATQEADGHWSQNSWLDGRPYWSGVQIDETGFPILLYDMLLRAEAIQPAHTDRYIRMIEAAAGYIIRNGPVTQQDRWEEDSGYSPFTIAVEIAALLAAADALDAAGKHTAAVYVRDTADYWNEQIESWTYASDTEMSRKLGISGYYMRIGYAQGDGISRSRGFIPIRNRNDANAAIEAGLLISPDALALVRFGLRAANDPRILDTVTAIDSLLRRDLPAGPYWYRYNNDGYGEHADGAPFDGAGIGRLWPLLTGERAHYELAAGKPVEAKRLLAAMEASAGSSGLLPEQIWDKADIPERELFLGRPSGSAMPLVWAHAEHIKLLRSLKDGAVFDMPPQPFDRYVRNPAPIAPVVWRMTSETLKVTIGRRLRLEFMEPATVHWSPDNWVSIQDSNTIATGFGTHVCDLPTDELANGRFVIFAVHWTQQDKWAGKNFRVDVVE